MIDNIFLIFSGNSCRCLANTPKTLKELLQNYKRAAKVEFPEIYVKHNLFNSTKNVLPPPFFFKVVSY